MGQQEEAARKTSFLPRQRLTTVLAGVTARKVAVITAPGGYGKTTVVRDLADRLTGVGFCWLALDPADDSLPIFLQQLARAAAPYLPPGGLARLTPDHMPTEPEFVRHLGRLVAAELGGHAEEHLMIVLDDLHHIGQDSLVLIFLDAMLQALPPTVHLILTSRVKPRLPLARLQARGEMINLELQDLSFTPEEIRQLFADRCGFLLSDHLLELLNGVTEGWITAVILVGNLLKAMPQAEWPSFLRRFPGGGALFDFLAEEIFEQQPPPTQELLLGTGILSRLQPLVIERMLGVTGAGAILREMEAQCLFLRPVAEGDVTYRYHHLFQNFLRQQLVARRGQAEALRLHAEAGRVYEGLGDLAEATEHYLAAGEYERAAALMAEQVDAALKGLRHGAVSNWLERIPSGYRETNPDVLYVRAQLAGWLAQHQILPALYQRCLELYEERGNHRGLARCLSWVTHRFWRLRRPYFFEAPQRWGQHVDPEVRIYGRLLKALTRTRQGEWDAAFAQLEQTLQEIPPATRAYFDCLEMLAVMAFWMGESRRALKYGIPQTVGRTALGDFSWGLYNWLAFCFLADPVGLEEYHRQYLAQDVPPAMRSMHELVGTLGQGIIHLYHSRWEDALVCLESLVPYFTDASAGFRAMGSEATFTAQLEIADIYARLGRRKEARCWLERTLTRAAGYPELAALAHASMAQFLVDEGDMDGARTHSARAVAADPPGVNGMTTVSVALASARVALAEGEREAAREALGRAVSLARKREATWYLLQKGGPEILPLLVEMARNPLPCGLPGQVIFEMVGAMGAEATRVLSPLLGHEDPAIRGAAFTLLDQLQHGKGPQAVPVLKIYALGPLRVYRYDLPVDAPDWKRNKVKLLFLFLLLRRGKPISKRTISHALWPDATPETARSNLRATMHGLKRALEPDLAPGAASHFLISERESLALGGLQGVWFDLWEFEDLVSRAKREQQAGRGERGVQLYQAACDLTRGAFLPEPAFADYFQEIRVRMEQAYTSACLAVTEACLAAGDCRVAIEYAQRALLLDAASEDAYKLMIEAYLALGERDRAVHVYKMCRKQMRHLLGTEPSSHIRSLLDVSAGRGTQAPRRNRVMS